MNRRADSSLDRRAAQWVEAGPTQAPERLLDASLARSRAVRQRPAWLAIALGAPTASEQVARRSRAFVRPLIAVAIALLLLGAVLVAAGALRLVNRPIVAIVSPTPAAPESTSAPIAVPASYRLADWGIEIANDPSDPWTDVAATFNRAPIRTDDLAFPQVDGPYIYFHTDQVARDFAFGPCGALFCEGPLVTVSIARGPAELVVSTGRCAGGSFGEPLHCTIRYRGGQVPVTITGTSLAELRDSWLAKLGSATVEPATLDGEPAVLLRRGAELALLAVHNDVRVAIIIQPLGLATSDEREASLASLIAGFHFLPDPIPQ